MYAAVEAHAMLMKVKTVKNHVSTHMDTFNDDTGTAVKPPFKGHKASVKNTVIASRICDEVLSHARASAFLGCV